MKTRIASVNEEQFQKCLEKKVWGSNNNSIDKWEIGDLLIFSVNREIGAVAEIVGESYLDDSVIWDNGIFWNRIEIDFKYVLEPKNRIPIVNEIREFLYKDWGKNYGWGILNKVPLEEETAKIIISMVEMAIENAKSK